MPPLPVVKPRVGRPATRVCAALHIPALLAFPLSASLLAKGASITVIDAPFASSEAESGKASNAGMCSAAHTRVAGLPTLGFTTGKGGIDYGYRCPLCQ